MHVKVASLLLLGCLWSSDRTRDEVENRAEVFDLLTGQVPRHGPAYHERRVRQCRDILSKSPGSTNARIDLSASLIGLGRFDEAEALLRSMDPSYLVLSNLGALHRRRGDFDMAARFIDEALTHNPEGHSGLGDAYPAMLRSVAARRRAPGGMTWTRSFRRAEELLRADPDLPEAVEALAYRSHFNTMHLWGYLYAKRIGHPDPESLERRFARSVTRLRSVADEFWTLRPEDGESIRRGIERDLDAAAEWCRQFAKAEADLVAAGADASFAETERELERRGIRRMRPPDRGLIWAPWDPRTLFGRVVLPFLLLAACVLLRLRAVERRADRRRRARAAQRRVRTPVARAATDA